MKWYEKTRNHDLYVCTTTSCNVVTFKKALCPFCGMPGTLIREAKTFVVADRIEGEKRRRESETLKRGSEA